MDKHTALRHFGFNKHQAGVYLALVKSGPSIVKEIVKESRVPRNRVYEALAYLQSNHFVSLVPGSKPKRFITTGILEQKQSEVNNTIRNINLLVPNQKFFLTIKGQKQSMKIIEKENNNTQEEILSCNTFSKIKSTNLKSMENAVKRGVDLRILTRYKKENQNRYQFWIKLGAQIRFLNVKDFGEFTPRFSVFDSKKARFTIGSPEIQRKEEYLTMFTESRSFVLMLKSYFETLWEKSKKI